MTSNWTTVQHPHLGYSVEVINQLLDLNNGDGGGSVVKVLCYKSEGRWFGSRWCHWNISLT